MSSYRFYHRSDKGEVFHAVERGSQVTVHWFDSILEGHEYDGHDQSGTSEYTAREAADYLARGIWIRLDDQPRNLCEETPLPGEELGVARPILETRKIGKVQVNMVDQGFPNALMEVARVMTWAGVVKGYKLHDWKNLPDAENAFEGAGSRHRMEHNIARQAGAALIDITDHESELLHKAHEAFNVLAELELILTKKIV